jgi:hypothetical protein
LLALAGWLAGWLAGLPESSHLVVALQNSLLRRNWFSACPQVPRFEVLSKHQPESQRLQKAVVSKRASHAERKLLSGQNNMKKNICQAPRILYLYSWRQRCQLLMNHACAG